MVVQEEWYMVRLLPWLPLFFSHPRTIPQGLVHTLSPVATSPMHTSMLDMSYAEMWSERVDPRKKPTQALEVGPK